MSVKSAIAAFLFAASFAFGAKIVNGEKLLDDNGVHINAHGGGMLFHEGKYWWFGEHKVATSLGNTAQVGVHCYSSEDLLQWKDEGIALKVSEDPKSDIVRGCILERPKVIYCPATGKFSMFFHLELKDQGYDAARVGIAVADKVSGPYRFLRSLRPTAGSNPLNAKSEELTPEAKKISEELGNLPGGPSEDGQKSLIWPGHVKGGQMCRDMTLFVDDDGKAYHIFASEHNSTLHIAELTPDFLGYTGRWIRFAEKDWTEAPAICKHNGWYYIIGSGCTGWNPNAARYYRARNLFGMWQRMGNPCKGVNSVTGLGPELTWGGQSTFIIPVKDKPGRFIAMFDVWRPKNPIDGMYLFLPIEFTDSGLMEIKWKDELTKKDVE